MSENGETRRPAPLQRRLGVRLGLALCLGAALILAITGATNLYLERNDLISLHRARADEVVEATRVATREAMMRNSPEDLARILEALGTQPEIERIRVFDKRGRINHSTDAAEVGRFVDTDAEQCFACHQPDRPLESLDRDDRMRIFDDAEAGRTLGVILPLQNEPSCSDAACHAHPPSQSLLGVLDVHLSLAPVEAHLRSSERQLVVGIVSAGLGVLALAMLLTWRLVLRPVRRLTAAASQVAAGDLSARIPRHSDDEIGELTGAWNEMTSELERARNELRQWGETLEERVTEKTAELEKTHRQLLVVEKMASLGKLAAVVAHEINNPLAGINTYARLLLRRRAKRAGGRAVSSYREDALSARVPAGGSDPGAAAAHEHATAADPGAPDPGEAADDAVSPAADDTDRVLELIEEEAARCGRIVRNLLLFSRSSGTSFEPAQIGPHLERCALLVHHRAEMENVELATHVDDSLPPVECDASQIEQLALALTLNAIEATSPEGHVTLAARVEGGGVVIEVRDDGPGIAPEIRQRIFEPFFSTKDKASGVGLGLAVVYGIVTRHRGRIDLRTAPGEGTTFRVWLPLEQPQERAPLDGGTDPSDAGLDPAQPERGPDGAPAAGGPDNDPPDRGRSASDPPEVAVDTTAEEDTR